MFFGGSVARRHGPSLRDGVAHWLFDRGTQVSTLQFAIGAPVASSTASERLPRRRLADNDLDRESPKFRRADDSFKVNAQTSKVTENTGVDQHVHERELQSHEDCTADKGGSPSNKEAAITSSTEITQTGKVPVAAFDFDHTLVLTKSGFKFARGSNDWVWFASDFPSFLETVSRTHLIVIFTNQAGVIPKMDAKSLIVLEKRLKNPLLTLHTSKVAIYAATRDVDPRFRKPGDGMFRMLEKDLRAQNLEVDFDKSYFVGDAAGRKDDFSDSDIGFAKAAGLRFYTPEEWRDKQRLQHENTEHTVSAPLS